MDWSDTRSRLGEGAHRTMSTSHLRTAMNVVIYARVSEDSARIGRSIREQIAECRAWATREGWTVTAVLNETGSASSYAKSARPEWAKLLRLLATSQVDAVITWEASRAVRDLGNYAEFRRICRDYNVLWGYSGRLHDLGDRGESFRTALDTLAAEDEVARTSERVKRATDAYAARGLPNGRILWGYQRIYHDTSRQLLTIRVDPVIRDLIRDAATRFLSGASLSSIAKDWNNNHVPTRSGAPAWTHNAVRATLANPSYAGLRASEGQADWPPILTLEQHELIQQRLDQNTTESAGSAPTTLLTGIGRCGQCGAPLRNGRQTSANRSTGQRSTYRVYQCSASRDTSSHVSAKTSTVDAYIRDQIAYRLRTQGLVASPLPAEALHNAEIADLDQRIHVDLNYLAQVERTSRELHDPGLLRGQRQYVLPRIEANRARLGHLIGVPDELWELAAAPDIGPAFDALDLTTQRTIVRAIARPVLTPGRAPRSPQRHVAVAIRWLL
jgi:DNA invertase Pin-like site-specific DNA recombinase